MVNPLRGKCRCLGSPCSKCGGSGTSVPRYQKQIVDRLKKEGFSLSGCQITLADIKVMDAYLAVGLDVTRHDVEEVLRSARMVKIVPGKSLQSSSVAKLRRYCIVRENDTVLDHSSILSEAQAMLQSERLGLGWTLQQ